MNRSDFVVFILSFNRADKVYTLDALKKVNYTGPIRIIVSTDDPALQQYITKFGQNNLYIFDKNNYPSDTIDVQWDKRSPVFARNAVYDIAEKLGYTYFLVLDDDYVNFRSRVVINNSLRTVYIKNFDKLVDIVLEFLENSNACTVALSQIGDFIGGKNSKVCKDRLTRKAMNSFFCKVSRKIVWSGKMNDDVTTYTTLGSRGKLFFTIADVSIDQLATQSVSGGLTTSYKLQGTYLKSFYSVVSSPSSVKVSVMGETHKRFHHIINWENAVPKIIRDIYKIK